MSYKLLAEKRVANGEKVRAEGLLPGVVYGGGINTESIAIRYNDFKKMYTEAGESSLIDLLIGDKNLGKVLIQDIQYDPVSGKIIHVDLRHIDMNKSMTAKVVINFVGESPIIKSSGGTLVFNVKEVLVECLPKDLVSHIDVNLAVLETYENVIKIKNLILPPGIKVLEPHEEDMVAKAIPALTEDEIKAMEEAATAADLTKIELAGKKKEEEEEGAEGAEAGAAVDEKAAKGGAAAGGKEEKKEEKKKEEKK